MEGNVEDFIHVCAEGTEGALTCHYRDGSHAYEPRDRQSHMTVKCLKPRQHALGQNDQSIILRSGKQFKVNLRSVKRNKTNIEIADIEMANRFDLT